MPVSMAMFEPYGTGRPAVYAVVQGVPTGWPRRPRPTSSPGPSTTAWGRPSSGSRPSPRCRATPASPHPADRRPSAAPPAIERWVRAALTTNEGQIRIEYKFLVLSYVFPEIKLLFPEQNYNVLSPTSYTHISKGDLYSSRIGLPIMLLENWWTDPGNI